jgi:hypothetical protein
MRRARSITALVPVLACLTAAGVTRPAYAQEDKSLDSKLGLNPTSPAVGSLPGGMTPSYGQKPADQHDWRFDFHGFLTAPLRAGLNTREDPAPGQGDLVLHAPPVVPDDKETFSHTGVVPTPFTQLNLSYGNSIVTGNVSIVADQANVSTGFFDPPSQLGVNDLFISIVPDLGSAIGMNIKAGAFSSRYGVMGEYDEGRYGTPVIARIKGVGESVSAGFDLGELTLMVEQGIKGQSNKAAADLIPAGWNGFGNANEGSTFINHISAGVAYKEFATLGLHFINAFSADERATGPNNPDGSLMILGADLRLTMREWGHLYFVVSNVEAEAATTISRVIEVLNTKGGPGLVENYLGDDSNGYGNLLTFGAQYDLSLGRLLSHPVHFYPDGPDLYLSLFGMQTMVDSDDPDNDGVTKRKLGGEVTYSFLSWLAASTRYDKVDPNVDNQRFSFAVVSPRLIFRTDWTATDQVVLQYSHWFNGSLTTVRTGYPARENVTAHPDEDMVSISASMWW